MDTTQLSKFRIITIDKKTNFKETKTIFSRIFHLKPKTAICDDRKTSNLSDFHIFHTLFSRLFTHRL